MMVIWLVLQVKEDILIFFIMKNSIISALMIFPVLSIACMSFFSTPSLGATKKKSSSGSLQTTTHITLLKSIRYETKLRVKVFPHKRNYPPHGKDLKTNRLSLVSRGSCKYFKGQTNKPKKSSKKAIGKKSSFKFNTKSFHHPIFIECNKPVKIVREKSLDSYSYPGSLYIHKVKKKGGSKQFEVINIVKISDYLKGVVPSEVYAGWPFETLKTQAVAARTYAIFHLTFSRRYNRSRFFDVDDTVLFQAYTGISSRTKRTDNAINATSGEILLFNNKVIQAYYHADSGGFTEDPSLVWHKKVPFIKGQKEMFYLESKKTEWDKTINLKKLSKNLAKLKIINKKSKIISLSVPVGGRTINQRVRWITVGLKNGTFKNVSIDTFKQTISRLPSTLFRFEPAAKNKKTYKIVGQGFGHGVGMSQKGAEILASNNGWTYDQILGYYYLETDLCTLWPKRPKKKAFGPKRAGCYRKKKSSSKIASSLGQTS